jgi:hypothetical protein
MHIELSIFHFTIAVGQRFTLSLTRSDFIVRLPWPGGGARELFVEFGSGPVWEKLAADGRPRQA